MPPSATKLRLFVGVYPPIDVSRELLARLDSAALPEHRRTPAEQIHLTLHFIGTVTAKDLDATIESVERSAAGVGGFALKPLRLIALPASLRPRLVACETDAPGDLLEIRTRLVRRLALNVRTRPSDRFLPHLTLCRFRTPGRAPLPSDLIDLPAFEVQAVRLMRSVMHPDGARHIEVSAFDLA